MTYKRRAWYVERTNIQKELENEKITEAEAKIRAEANTVLNK